MAGGKWFARKWGHLPVSTREKIAGIGLSLLPVVGGYIMGARAGRVRENAEIDKLTGVFTKWKINELLQKNLRKAGAKAPLSIIKTDFDNFKLLNDALGHEFADGVLRKFAVGARELIRQDDLVGKGDFNMGRHGIHAGDEFIFLFRNVPRGTAEKIADRIRKLGEQMNGELISAHGEEINRHLAQRGISKPFRFGVSAGVHTESRHEPLEHVLNEVDKRMYEDKMSRKGRIWE